jgi:hypothetical protein
MNLAFNMKFGLRTIVWTASNRASSAIEKIPQTVLIRPLTPLGKKPPLEVPEAPLAAYTMESTCDVVRV